MVDNVRNKFDDYCCIFRLVKFAINNINGSVDDLRVNWKNIFVLANQMSFTVLAKIGIDGVNSNLATAIRTLVVVVMAWGMVFLTNSQTGISEISKKSWLFLILSGLATGASWLCYYKALQVGEASKVVPVDKLSVVITLVLAFVFLHEEFTVKSLIGCILIAAGTLIMVI